MEKFKNVVDSNRVSYKVLSELGKGSQGTTYLLNGERHIAKLFNVVDNPIALKSKISFLRGLDLSKDDFAIPLAELTQPAIGYISEFASEMEPLSTLRWTNQAEDMGEWFAATGGLLKRIQVLIRLAERLQTLHSKALIYCDLSPNNVFVSSDPKRNHVFLIDLDNLRYKTNRAHNIYTPFYGAPEVVNGCAANSIEGDCFSFAVIAYELLTLNHPLIGDYVSDGDPELEQMALEGRLPWVDHSADPQNNRSCGIPSDYFIPSALQLLFKRTFEDGLNLPEKRPSISEWCSALSKVLNELIHCPECHLHYPISNAGGCCPLCHNASTSLVKVEMRRWEEALTYDQRSNEVTKSLELAPVVLEELLLDAHTTKYIKRAHFLLPGKPNAPVLAIKVHKADEAGYTIEIQLEDRGAVCYVGVDPHNLSIIEQKRSVRLQDRCKGLIVAISTLDTPQRVLVIR